MQYQPHNRHVPTTIWGMTLHVDGLRWHDPISVVGTLSRSKCYGVVAPPRSWDRGILNAAHCTSSAAFYRARKFPKRVLPCSEKSDSGWNCTPQTGRSRCRIA
jgi:hypothetical protein